VLRGTLLLSNVSYNVMIILLMLVFMHVIPTCNNLVATWVQYVWCMCATAYADINTPSPPDVLGATLTPAEQGARRQCGRGLGETVRSSVRFQAGIVVVRSSRC
jgi:hypothetical protein